MQNTQKKLQVKYGNIDFSALPVKELKRRIALVSDTGKAPRETERALNALIDAWTDERGCSRLIAAGYAADAARREYDAISKRVNVPS